MLAYSSCQQSKFRASQYHLISWPSSRFSGAGSKIAYPAHVWSTSRPRSSCSGIWSSSLHQLQKVIPSLLGLSSEFTKTPTFRTKLVCSSPRIQSMDYLHAFGYARSQSVRPCYLRSDHDFCMHFRQFIFRLISDKFRQSMGNSR